jgi:hypothetical protein
MAAHKKKPKPTAMMANISTLAVSGPERAPAAHIARTKNPH